MRRLLTAQAEGRGGVRVACCRSWGVLGNGLRSLGVEKSEEAEDEDEEAVGGHSISSPPIASISLSSPSLRVDITARG